MTSNSKTYEDLAGRLARLEVHLEHQRDALERQDDELTALKGNALDKRDLGWLVIVGLLILSFFGYSNWYAVPNEVNAQLPERVKSHLDTEYGFDLEDMEKLSALLRSEQGALLLHLAPKAYVAHMTGGNCKHNIASIKHVGQGRFKVMFTTPMDDSDYVALATADTALVGSEGSSSKAHSAVVTERLRGSCTVAVYDPAGTRHNRGFSLVIFEGTSSGD